MANVCENNNNNRNKIKREKKNNIGKNHRGHSKSRCFPKFGYFFHEIKIYQFFFVKMFFIFISKQKITYFMNLIIKKEKKCKNGEQCLFVC